MIRSKFKRRFLRAFLALVALVLVLWVAGTIGIYFREPDTLTTLPANVPGRIIDVSGHKVHVVERGSGPAIVLIAGTGGSQAMWPEEVVQAFSMHHRVVAIDLFGWGFSERDNSFPYGFQLWSDQIYQTLNVLGVEKTAVIGHSLGAAVADVFAGQHPEMTTHLVVSGHGETLAPAYFAMIAPGLGESIYASKEVPFETYSARHLEQERMAYRIRGTRYALLKNARRTLFESNTFFSSFPKIQAPVLQFHGAQDEEIPEWAMRRTHGRYPSAQKKLIIVEGSRHFVMCYKPAEYIKAVLEFIDTIPAQPAAPASTQQ